MIELFGITLLRPLWLCALPVIAVLAVASRRATASGWSRLLDPRLASHLRAFGYLRSGGRGVQVPALAAAAAIGALALAGPATRSGAAPALRNLETLVVVVDLSQSVTEGGSLDRVRALAARLFAAAAGRPLALVVYAGDAYLASPPTDDPRLLDTVVAVLDRDTVPDDGSRPDRALALARELLADAPARRRDVVLVSDGGGLGPEALHEASLLRHDGARLSAVFVAPSERPYGMPPPRPDALAELVGPGGGVFGTEDAPAPLENALAANPEAAVPREIAALALDDQGRAVLVLALLPTLLLFRRRR